MRRGVLALWLALAACTPGLDTPAEPVWGKQACGHCSMLVTEKPPSAQATLEDGTRLFFDDVGCLAAWLDRAPAARPRGLWVRRGEAWVPAPAARYASGVSTPMDFGFVAAEAGVDWDQVRSAVRAKTRHVRELP